jgi:hypothetical protein
MTGAGGAFFADTFFAFMTVFFFTTAFFFTIVAFGRFDPALARDFLLAMEHFLLPAHPRLQLCPETIAFRARAKPTTVAYHALEEAGR